MAGPVFRFAPSPNGRLHLGHALSAGLNAKLAAETGGRFLLRMEDIDTERSTPALQRHALDDLRWLGLSWEEPVRCQSRHMAEYRSHLDRLVGEGLVYPAFMSRGAVRAHAETHSDWPRDPDGAPLYPGTDRGLSAPERQSRIASGAPYAWRLDMSEALRRAGPLHWREWTDATLTHSSLVEADPSRWGDVMIARAGLPTSYHLSVVSDDALQGITHVVRGADLAASTSVHRLLQHILGLPTPTYLHHRLVPGADGRKLSKSEKATGLAALRDAGWTPGDVWEACGIEPP